MLAAISIPGPLLSPQSAPKREPPPELPAGPRITVAEWKEYVAAQERHDAQRGGALGFSIRLKKWRKWTRETLVAHAPNLPRMTREMHRGTSVEVRLLRVWEPPLAEIDPGNIAHAFKHVADGVADVLFLECDRHRGWCGHWHDSGRETRITWQPPTQQKGTPARVEVTVEWSVETT